MLPFWERTFNLGEGQVNDTKCEFGEQRRGKKIKVLNGGYRCRESEITSPMMHHGSATLQYSRTVYTILYDVIHHIHL